MLHPLFGTSLHQAYLSGMQRCVCACSPAAALRTSEVSG
jgi:hypothetical protein